MHGSVSAGYAKNRTVPGCTSETFATAICGHSLRSFAVSAFNQIQPFPATIPKLVSTRNFVNCRRWTYASSDAWTENSSAQTGVVDDPSFASIGASLHVILDVHLEHRLRCRRHHEYLRPDVLSAEAEVSGCPRRALPLDHLGGPVGQRLTGAHSGAHRPQADRGAVVAHVTL